MKDMLKLDVPEAEYVDVTLDASEAQTAQVEALVERAKKVRAGQVEPNEDNMLAITNDGRKAALDERLLNPSLPPDEGSKAAECARQAYEIWMKTADFKGTQLIFCDLSTPKTDKAYTDEAAVETLLDGTQWDCVCDFIGFVPAQVERDWRLFRGRTKQYIYISSASAYHKPAKSYIINEGTGGFGSCRNSLKWDRMVHLG